MKNLYLPLYRMAVSYLFSYGRRWSILEHMLLVEVATQKSTADELSRAAGLPHRLVVEALINLLRANWIEVRSDGGTISFAATPAGERRAKEKGLPERLQRDIRWDSVCVDRVTGHWMRADDLDLVYERDLPPDCEKLAPLLYTFEPNDAALRDLFRLNLNESLEPTAPQFRTPSMPYARVGIAFNEVQSGLPASAPLALKSFLIEAAGSVSEDKTTARSYSAPIVREVALDDLSEADLIVGGPAHLQLLKEALDRAGTAIVIHSCFLSSETLKVLLPDFERAAKRRVQVELLWGLYTDPENKGPSKKVSEAVAVLNELPTGARGRVRLSPNSSGSHAKIIMYDDRETKIWTTIVGSCNFLSSNFDWTEVSVRTRSALFGASVMSRLLANQLPSVGNWSGTARRLNAIWSTLKQRVRTGRESGQYSISLITDHDHYSCVTLARDQASRDIEIVCDLYGLSAETSVLVPMTTAAARKIEVVLKYTRPSKFLLEEGQEPSPTLINERGIRIEQIENGHAKYLGWDDDNLVVTSFNWMATALDSRRSRGAEIGAFVRGPDIRQMLSRKLAATSEIARSPALEGCRLV